MNRHPFTDGWKIAASLLAGYVGAPLLLILLGAGLALVFTACPANQDAKVAALVETIRVTDTVAKVQTDTLIVYRESSRKAKAASDSVKLLSDSLDRLVAIRDDSTLVVPDHVEESPDFIHVPPVVIENLRSLRMTVAKQDTTIHWLTVENRSLWMRDTTRQQQIDYRDKLIRELSKPRCNRKCGFLLGVGAAVLIHKAAK